MGIERAKWLVWLDVAVAACATIALAWCFYAGNREAEEAVRKYGHNVDSGAYVILFGILFFVPAALLFSLAAAAIWRHWRARWILQSSAIAWLLLPVIGLLRG